jgi:hypothetical protein
VACGCTGTNAGFPFDVPPLYTDATIFDLNYGESCNAWEASKCNEMWPENDELGDWCCTVGTDG